MTNLHDKAYDLEKAVRNSKEFTELKVAFEAMMADADAKKLFENFRDTQVGLQEQQMSGAEIAEEDLIKAQEMVEEVQKNDKISDMMDKENRLNVVMNDVSRILTKPMEELYSVEAE